MENILLLGLLNEWIRRLEAQITKLNEDLPIVHDTHEHQVYIGQAFLGALDPANHPERRPELWRTEIEALPLGELQGLREVVGDIKAFASMLEAADR